MGAQTAMGSVLRGTDPVPLARAIQAALVQTLPWAPVTLAAIALATAFPLAGDRWPRHAAVHLAALAVLAWAANVLVVLGFWTSAGRFMGIAELARQGVVWAVVNFHAALLIYGAVVAITHGVLYYRRTRARELHLARVEGQLARAHLQALTAQIRPHFLFNTLHTIGQLWRSGRSDDADAVLDHLGSLFHKVQRSTSQLEVPLAEEMELVREYLSIEEARFRDRLQTSVRATPDALECLVPPLILQPLVENAIRHGFSTVSAAGRVEVSACVRDERLHLTVQDDGPGMDAAPARPGSGTGLRNTRERLAQLYGAGAELRITSVPDGGALVALEFPASRR
jgi:signal transduction histidine kinase